MTCVKSPYSMVKLNITSWDGDPCVEGDEMRTRTGRRYQVIAIKGKTHHCLVLPADAEVQGRVFELRWNKRNRRTN